MGVETHKKYGSQISVNGDVFTGALKGANPAVHPLDMGIKPTVMYNSESVVKDGSNNVSKAFDLSGNYNHLTQSVGANQFLWVDNQLNGYPILRLADLDFMDLTTPITPPASAGESYTFFMVYKRTGATMIGLGGTGSLNPYSLFTNNSFIYAGDQDSRHVHSGSNDTDFTQVTISRVYNLGDNYWFQNGIALSPGSRTVNTSSLDFVYLGRRGSDYSEGDIAEVIYYDQALPQEDIENIERYLNIKYDLYPADYSQPSIETVSAEIDQIPLPLEGTMYDTFSWKDDFHPSRNVDYQFGRGNYNLYTSGGTILSSPDQGNHKGIVEGGVGGVLNNYISIVESALTKIVYPGFIFETQISIDYIEGNDATDFTINYIGLANEYRQVGNHTHDIEFQLGDASGNNTLVTNTKSSGSLTTTDTGLAILDNTWYNLRWEYDGVEVRFYADKVEDLDRNNYTLVSIHSTNIPVDPMFIHYHHRKLGSAPTTAVNSYIDYVYMEQPIIR